MKYSLCIYILSHEKYTINKTITCTKVSIPYLNIEVRIREMGLSSSHARISDSNCYCCCCCGSCCCCCGCCAWRPNENTCSKQQQQQRQTPQQCRAIAVGNNGAFAIFAAVTQSSDKVARGRRQRRGKGMEGVGEPGAASEGAQCTKQQRQRSSSLSKRNPKRQAIFLF